MKIYFVRHGQTETNVRTIHHLAGDDAQLNQLGLAQANQAAQIVRHKEPNIQLIISSPRKRARQTAKIIANGLNLAKTAENEACTVYFDDLGTEAVEVLELWQTNQQHNVPDLIHATLDLLLAQKFNNVLFVSHAPTIKSVVFGLLNQPEPAGFFANGSVSSLEYKNGSWQALFLDLI